MTNFRILCLFLFVTAITTTNCSDSSLGVEPDQPQIPTFSAAKTFTTSMDEVYRKQGIEIENSDRMFPLPLMNPRFEAEQFTADGVFTVPSDLKTYLVVFSPVNSKKSKGFIARTTVPETSPQGEYETFKVASWTPWNGTKSGLRQEEPCSDCEKISAQPGSIFSDSLDVGIRRIYPDGKLGKFVTGADTYKSN